MRLEVTIPIRIVSELNMSEHWTAKHKRRKNQRKWLKIAFCGKGDSYHIPCVVTIKRIAPRSLDEDNLIGACKCIRDFIADMLIPGLAPGRADADNQIKWTYEQEKAKEYACHITIESL